MTRETSSRARWLAVGNLWIGDDGRALHVLSRSTGASSHIAGALRDAVLAGDGSDARLRTLARIDPQAGDLEAALSTHALRPLTRAELLRRDSWGLLFIELTGRCNERCTHCYADASPERREALDAAKLRAIIDDAVELGFEGVQLTGGDPLLSPHLLSTLRYAREGGIPTVEIFTNGLLLSDALLDGLEPHSPCFAFSVYSDDDAKHDAVTQVRGSHARTLAAMTRCLERGLRVRAGVTLMGEDPSERERIRNFLLSKGLEERALHFAPSRAVGRGRAVGGLEGAAGHGLTSSGGKACVAYTGDVYPCIFARHMRLGNVHEARLGEILGDRSSVTADPASLATRGEAAGERLACHDCRMNDALLAQAAALPVLP